MVLYEGLGARLDPGFRLAGLLEPYAAQLVRRRYSPARLAPGLARAGLDAARLGVDLPAQVRRLMADLDRGTLEVGVRPEHFEPLVRRLERLANRLVLGILAAAFVNGLAVLLAAYHPPGWEGWIGALFAFGLAVADRTRRLPRRGDLRSGRG